MPNLILDRISDDAYKCAIERRLLSPKCPCLMMISGGSDSSAMAYVAHTWKESGRIENIAALHVNHMLRGKDSDGDEEFVDELCKNLDIPLFKVSVDVNGIISEKNENMEAAARRERYASAADALASLCEHTDSPLHLGRIITAHTLDDRIENFYMRSIVGTGPGGFRSMKYRNGNVVRPLLDFKRQELQEMLLDLDENDVVVTVDKSNKRWRIDATNAHTERFRAYVRHKMLPVASEWNDSFYDTLQRSMNLIGDEDDMLSEMSDNLIESSVEFDASAPSFKLLPEFCTAHPCIQKRAVFSLLSEFLGPDVRVENASVLAVLGGIDKDKPKSGYTSNIQGNLAVSSNKSGILVETMETYRRRRKPNKQ